MTTSAADVPTDATDATQHDAAEKSSGGVPPAHGDGCFHLPDIPLWTRWALVSVLSYAIPFYKTVLRVEGRLQDEAEILADDVEKVSMVVQKVAAEIAAALPKDCIVENGFVMIEHIAEEASEEAQKAEAFIHKVDKIKENVEENMEPYIEKGEEIIDKEGKVE